MSIVGRRKRRLALAWFMGVITAVLVFGVLMLYSVLDITSFIQMNKEKVIQKEVEEVVQIVASRPIEAGSVLDEDDLLQVMVPIELAVNHGLSLSELIGLETRIDIDQSLPITTPMIVASEQVLDEERLYEFDYVRLPHMLNVGDVIDVRIVFPNGQDYVVLAKKEVIQYERQAESIHEGLLSLMIGEDEVLRMSSALVDAILTETAELYTVRYVDPVNQEAAKISYPVNRSVLSILEKNPNILAMPDMKALTENRLLLDSALKELLDEDDEWFSIFKVLEEDVASEEDATDDMVGNDSAESGIVERSNHTEGTTNQEVDSGPSDIAGF